MIKTGGIEGELQEIKDIKIGFVQFVLQHINKLFMEIMESYL